MDPPKSLPYNFRIVTGFRDPPANPGKWGIYKLTLSTQEIRLIYSSSNTIFSSALRMNGADNTLLFAEKIGGASLISIFTR